MCRGLSQKHILKLEELQVVRSLTKSILAGAVCMAGLAWFSTRGILQLAPAMQNQVPGGTRASSPGENIPSCGAGSAVSATNPPAASPNPNPHKVTLSWNAGVPASVSQHDAIKGYYVYRSLSSQTYGGNDRLNTTPVPGTTCVDLAVEAGGTYFYVVRAVSQSGAQSGFSNEIKAVIPSDDLPHP